MTDPSAVEASPSPATPSPWWLLLRVLDEPVQVFRALASRPRIVAPLAAMLVAFVVFGFATPAEQLREQARQQAEIMRRRAAQMPEERRAEFLSTVERRIERAASPGTRALAAAGGAVTSVIGLTVAAAILMLVFGAIGSQSVPFKAEFAVVAHAYVPQLVGLLLMVALGAAGLRNVQLSPAFVTDLERSPFLFTLLSQFSVFAIWNVYLVALGNQILTAGKSIAGPLAAVGGLWLLKCLALAGTASLFAGLAG